MTEIITWLRKLYCLTSPITRQDQESFVITEDFNHKRGYWWRGLYFKKTNTCSPCHKNLWYLSKFHYCCSTWLEMQNRRGHTKKQDINVLGGIILSWAIGIDTYMNIMSLSERLALAFSLSQVTSFDPNLRDIVRFSLLKPDISWS